jgi:hypothetical protein
MSSSSHFHAFCDVSARRSHVPKQYFRNDPAGTTSDALDSMDGPQAREQYVASMKKRPQGKAV